MAILLLSVKQLFNYKLLLLYLSLCSIILLKSYFDPDGRISPDSTHYLRLSKNLVEGEGFRVPDYNSPDGQSFFAIWPVGYPIMIFIVSKLTGLGVVWASKVLNLLIIGLILLLFRYIFKENAHWAGLIFFIDNVILVFSFTWSEGPFILFLLCISISLYKCVETSGKLIWIAGLFFSGIALFLIRYIGLFSVGIIGLIALINLFKRRWLLSIKLLITSLLQLIFAGLYLYHNKISTGYITGMPRGLPEDSNLELLNQLFLALRDEFIVINCGIPLSLSFGLLLLLGIYLFSTRGKNHCNEKFNGLWKYFLLTGILYLATMIVTKWLSDFSPLDERYLFPSTFLIILSLALFLQGKPSVKIMNYPLVYLIIFATLSIHYIPHTDNIYKYLTTGFGYFKNPNYEENTRVILERYKGVEPKSIVIFGSIHLRYLRENIIPTEIYGKSSLKDMTKYFLQKKNWNVYINIRDNLDPASIHESIIRFMETNSDKQIVKIHQQE
jgi:hypothetical protein